MARSPSALVPFGRVPLLKSTTQKECTLILILTSPLEDLDGHVKDLQITRFSRSVGVSGDAELSSLLQLVCVYARLV